MLKEITLQNIAGGTLEKELDEALRKVETALSDPKVKGFCKINIQLQFQRKPETNWVESSCQVMTAIPTTKKNAILVLEHGKLLAETTSGNAQEPGLFESKDGKIVMTDPQK